jgi:hypothetical protein
MSDDTNNRGQADRSRIDVHEKYELAYWTKELGCTAEELKAAIAEVETSADAVRAHLGK